MSDLYDLHAHTTASDGTFSPGQLVRYAKERGLYGVAVTDHDSTDGIAEAMEEGQRMQIDVVPGVEINTEYEGKEVHVLGYYFDRHSKSLQELFSKLRTERITRMNRIVEKLDELGIVIDRNEIIKEAGEGAIGRPHIARVLIKKGYALDMRDAFYRYLGLGAPAYVERFKLAPADAIRMIREAKGVPVLAHPGLVGKDALIKELMPAGLLGIETAHPDHPAEARARYAKLARELGLIATGGSDFHGSGAEHRGDLGSVTVTKYVVDALKEKSGLF
ncbi:PHP domain-containing protein [Effusibacillus lacus]|uniref:Phosphatase n=1 Tax=Effusibacillus lacus TaxID=1348429 RepID=A0A292YTI7_9BACL|nr:PHP domain-containing protein [Effusibacillus lacus]GAX91795.1 phosphatase [Effusibacillus lacus]